MQDHFNQLSATGAWIAPLSSLIAAFVFGQLLAWTYERTYHGLSYSRGFSHALVLVCVAAAILVLSMQHSLIAGFGLFGVLSMIRFRTDLKTPRDLVFVMGSACLGVAAGVQGWLVAGMGTAVFVCVAFYLATGPFGSRSRFDGVLRFRTDAELGSTTSSRLDHLVTAFCRRAVLLSTTEIQANGSIEHVYQVKFFGKTDRITLLTALQQDVAVQDTRLMLQDSTAEY